MSTTEHDFHDTLRADFDERLPDMREDPYWSDTLSEIADSSVPVYTHDLVALWLDMGCPDIDDFGLIDGVTEVTKIIAITIYEQATAFLGELAHDAGLE